jgi:hypothetical protein
MFTAAITFASQLDERHLLEWGMQISGMLRWKQDTLVTRSSKVSQAEPGNDGSRSQKQSSVI